MIMMMYEWILYAFPCALGSLKETIVSAIWRAGNDYAPIGFTDTIIVMECS